MKKTLLFVLSVFLAIGLPMVLIWGAYQTAVAATNAPTVPAIPVVLDSGERWYDPFSWGLDEAAAIATQQAQEAATRTTKAVTTWTSSMFLLTGLLVTIAVGIWSGVREQSQLKNSWQKFRIESLGGEMTSGSTPNQVPPNSEDTDTEEQDSVVAGKAAKSHPNQRR